MAGRGKLGTVRSLLPKHSYRLAARLVCAALFWQVLVPVQFAPPSFALTGADGMMLPVVFCTQGQADRGDRNDDDGGQAQHHHCVLCRLPGFASLGAGAVLSPVLAGPPVRFERIGWDRSHPGSIVRVIHGFAARAPPSFPVA